MINNNCWCKHNLDKPISDNVIVSVPGNVLGDCQDANGAL